MTRDDIHTCSYFCARPDCIRAQRDELRDQMERRIFEAVAAEREACAKVCEMVAINACDKTARELSFAIRARGEK